MAAQPAQLDSLGYPAVTQDGIRCGNCKQRHPDVATVAECCRQAAVQEAQARAEIEAERRTERWYEERY